MTAVYMFAIGSVVTFWPTVFAWKVDLRLDVCCWIKDDWNCYPLVKLL
jgi:hypothetical protein